MKNLTLLILLLSITTLSRAGDTVIGNSADTHTPDSTWFLDESKTIKVCYDVSPKFGFSDKELTQAIETSFGRWVEYLDKKQHTSKYVAEGWLKPTSLIRATLHIAIQKTCQADSDLRIHFGTRPTEVTEAEKKYNNPIAFVKRDESTLGKSWGKGFMYLKEGFYKVNGKQNLTMLTGLMTHEFGHIFGNGHIANTIMDESISNYFLPDANIDHVIIWKMTQIDWENQIILCETCKIEYTLRAYGKKRYEITDLPITSSTEATIKQDGLNAELILKNNGIEQTFKIAFKKHFTVTVTDTMKAFYNYIGPADGWQQQVDYINPKRIIMYGDITGIDGKIIPVVAEINSSKYSAYRLTIDTPSTQPVILQTALNITYIPY